MPEVKKKRVGVRVGRGGDAWSGAAWVAEQFWGLGRQWDWG